jgi:hypothetical protein
VDEPSQRLHETLIFKALIFTVRIYPEFFRSSVRKLHPICGKWRQAATYEILDLPREYIFYIRAIHNMRERIRGWTGIQHPEACDPYSEMQEPRKIVSTSGMSSSQR